MGQWVVGFCAGAIIAAGLLLLAPAERTASHSTALAALAALLLLRFIPLTALGQAAGMSLSGLRWTRLSAPALVIRREENGMRVTWSLRWFWLSESVACEVHTFAELRRAMPRFVDYGLLGCGVHLLLMAVTVLTITVTGSFNAVSMIPLWVVTAFFAVNRGQGFLTMLDTRRTLRRGGPHADRLAAVYCLAFASANEQRPRDWDRDIVRHLDAPMRGAWDDVSAYHFAYSYALDTGDIDAAQRYLDMACATLRPEWRNVRVILLRDRALFLAWHRNDPITARHCYEQLPRRRRDFAALPGRAAVEFAEGNYDASAATARAGVAQLERLPPTGWSEMNLDILRAIIERIEQRSRGPATAVPRDA